MDGIPDEILDRILQLHSFLTLKGFEKRSRPGFTEALQSILITHHRTVQQHQYNQCGYYGPTDWVTSKHLTTAEINIIAREIGFSLPSRQRTTTTGAVTATTAPQLEEGATDDRSTTPIASPPIRHNSPPIHHRFTEIRNPPESPETQTSQSVILDLPDSPEIAKQIRDDNDVTHRINLLQLDTPKTPSIPPISPLTTIMGSNSNTIPGWITSIFSNNTPPATMYSKAQYKRDAVYIACMISLISNGQYQELAPLLKETDYTTAATLITCMDQNKKDEFTKKTKEVIADGTHAGHSVESFQRFLNRFRAGPSPSAPQDTELEVEDNIDHRNDNVGNSGKGKRPAHLPGTAEPAGRRNSGSSGWTGGSHSLSDAEDSDEPSSDPSDNGSHRTHHHRYRRSVYHHRKTLKAEDVSLFDPGKKSVTSFTKRMRQLARTYGNEAVLEVVPLCLRGEALDWYTHLSDRITDTMQESLTECIYQLEQRFKKSAYEARQEADRLKFRFEKEKELPLREYVERKTMLLHEANIKDEEEVVIRIWEKLDPTLMNTIRPEGLSLDEFSTALFRQEIPARLQWNQLNRAAGKQTSASSKSYSKKDRYKEKRTERSKEKDEVKDIKRSGTVKQERQRLRDCRHCGGGHWDFDCPTRRPAVKAYLVNTGDTDESLTESDKDALRELRRRTMDDSDSDSSDTSKN